MILFPAIDLKDGACVRLYKGDMAQATIYNADPVAQAVVFAETGFKYLHIVDLNGAVDGISQHAPVVERILAKTKLPIQLGGGIRNRAAIDHWLEKGVARVILGTVALTDPILVAEAARAYPGRIVVGLDAKDGMVATDGWYKTSSVSAVDLALTLEDVGVAAFLFTDIARDGTKTGVNIEATLKLADRLSTPVIASGGVGGLADIQALKSAHHPRLEGVIVGRALYDGVLDAKQALAVC
jgi:phosphoribosylformimino-5-aminoimidazole carboxamide ribotide isomerase